MKKFPFVILLFSFFLLCCICCSIVFLTSRFIFPLVEIEGLSMEPNFETGEVWLLDRTSSIERGDVLVFKKPGNSDYIKRVIALEGDTILIEDGEVYVNGIEYQEAYLLDQTKTVGGTFIEEGKTYTVPADSYFVMGDNRANSLDSRFVNIGFVKEEWVDGELLFRIWPFSD